MSFLFLLFSFTGIVGRFISRRGRGREQTAQACQQRTVGFARCLCWFLNRCGNYLPIVSGSVQPRIPETFVQFGETETAVYLRTFERVFAFGKGYALYLACLPLVFELDSNTLFR